MRAWNGRFPISDCSVSVSSELGSSLSSILGAAWLAEPSPGWCRWPAMFEMNPDGNQLRSKSALVAGVEAVRYHAVATDIDLPTHTSG